VILLNQLLRYAPVVSLLESSGGSRLLEVGSGSRGVASFLSARWEITACDRDFSDYGARHVGAAGRARRVVGDAADLPFADGEFDAVVSLDMLEHVSPDRRGTVLGELARVTRGRLVVGCPAGAAALEADRRLAERLRAWRRPVPGWLDEHLDNGFPEPSLLLEALSPHGRVRLLPNVAIGLHRAVALLEGAPGVWPVSVGLGAVLRPTLARPGSAPHRLLSALGRADAGRAYRTIAVLDRG
jgi:SAM-dependent methyltransferase